MLNPILTPALDLIKFGLVHMLLLPLLLTAFYAHKLLPQVDVVTASKLNIRMDSSLTAFSPGFLKEGTEIDVIHRGENWSQIEFDEFSMTVSKEEFQENNTGRYFVATKYIAKTNQDFFRFYTGWIGVVQLVCYLSLLVTNYKNFLFVLWTRIFSLKTIPEAPYYFLVAIISLRTFLKARRKRAAAGTVDQALNRNTE
uniref:hypothetical protein n=1 Tax=Microscilla sp. PRE1 TaxID=155537 RepID=UPI00146AB94C|nr:hypothetical protein [Microscilla sp. PRE1]